MSATVKPVRLPTEEEYDQALKPLRAAYDRIESLAWRLARLDPHDVEGEPLPVSFPPSRSVTAADVGLLWSFVDSARVTMDGIEERMCTLQGCLSTLDVARLDEKASRDA